MIALCIELVSKLWVIYISNKQIIINAEFQVTYGKQKSNIYTLVSLFLVSVGVCLPVRLSFNRTGIHFSFINFYFILYFLFHSLFFMDEDRRG